MTDPLGQSQVLPYLSGLTQHGYEFTLISCEKKARYQKNKATIQRLCEKAKIDWRPLFYSKSPPVLSTLYDLNKIRNLASRLHAEKKFSAIHCRSYISAIIGLEMKKKHNLAFIFDMRGFWADERLDGEIWTLKNPLYKKVFEFFKRKEIDFFSNADYTISLTEAGKKEIQAWDLPGQPIPIQVIPCCADLEVFDYRKITEVELLNLRRKLEINEEDFILGYLGSIGTWYCLSEMMQFFKQLLDQQPLAKFLFISKEDPQVVHEEAKRCGVPQDRIIVRSANRDEVATYLALIDCGIFFIKPVFSKKASSPTKQAEMMAMGLPLICNDIGDTGAIVSAYQVGISLDDFSETDFAKAIQEIPRLMTIPKPKIREVAIQQFALSEGVEKYAEVYKRVLQKEVIHA